MLTVPKKMNLKQTCRLCLGQGGVLSPIFLESVGGGEGRPPSAPQPQPQPTLPLRIMACAPIQVVEGDELPAQICHRCLYQVERSYDFKEQCESADKILRQYVAQIHDKSQKEEIFNNSLNVKLEIKEVSHGCSFENPLKEAKSEIMDENGLVDYSITKDSDLPEPPKPTPIEAQVKVNVLQSKLSALIHQTPLALPEEDVDSGLLESLADSDDLQVVGSEGETVNMGEIGGHKLDKFQDDTSDKSDSSDEEIRLRCKMCKDTFTEVALLEAHEAAHVAGGPPFKCSICNKVFSERVDLDSHWLAHGADNPHDCPICETSVPNEELLGIHIESHNISLPFPCVTCDKSYPSRQDLKKHETIHSGLRPFKCKMCPKEFVRSTNFNKHLRIHGSEKPFSCCECLKVFKTKGDLNRHEIIHTGQKPYICLICNLTFNRKDKLVRHERLHSGEKIFANNIFLKSNDSGKPKMTYGGEEPVQEEATDLSMPSKKDEAVDEQSNTMDYNEDDSTLDTESDNQLQICEDPIDEGISEEQGSDKLEMNHEKQTGVESMVISVDPFQMEQMDTGMKETDLPSNFSLKSIKSEYEKEEFSPNENYVEENVQENTKPYACEYCPKKFADKSYMKTHQLTHLGIRPHACSYCGKGFFRRRELLRHEAVHTGIKPFSCKTCNKAFARSDKLMRHERTHGDPKNFSCTQCPAVFSRKDELSRHGMCHTGERPHCCTQCFKSFFSRAELTRHEKTHAGLKPYKCEFCDQSFHRRDKLNRHTRTHMTTTPPPGDSASVLGTVHLHELLAAHCGQHFAAEVRVKDEKAEVGDDLKGRVDGSMDARALARLNQNPDIHLIPLKQN